jgi:diketogulonate reductase-like aldo/keto reductase
VIRDAIHISCHVRRKTSFPSENALCLHELSFLMETRSFGPTGRQVPVIGQGTWQIRDREAAREALRRGLELGMDHIDTAELYRGSEGTIAPILEGRRDEIFLVSKVHPAHAGYEETIQACHDSLARLKTDYLDVYLLHWWPGETMAKETMRAMGTLIDEGRIRYAGVSNLDVHDLEITMEALSPHEMACNQVLYHLNERSIEQEIVPYCEKKGIAVVGYTPFGRPFPPPSTYQGKVLQEIADAHGKTPRQVALRFLTRMEPLFTIPKAEKVEHVEENAGGADWQLTKGDLGMIEEAFPPPSQVHGVPVL